jgi:hypothetical protein
MKLILGMAVLVVLFGSLWADYRWRQWMKERKEERKADQSPDVK